MSGDGLDVSGGAGGVDATLTDIRTHATVLSDTGQELLEQAGPIAAVALAEEVLSAGVICPDVLPGVLVAIAAAEIGPAGVATSGAGLVAMGELTKTVVYTYEAVDQAAAEALNKIQAVGGYVAGAMLPAALLAGGAALLAAAVSNPVLGSQLALYLQSGQIGPDLQQFLFEHPEVTELLTRLAPGMVQGSLWSLSTLLGPLGPSLLSWLSGGTWPSADYEDSVAGLIALGNRAGLLEDTGPFHLGEGYDTRLDSWDGVEDIFNAQGSMNAGLPEDAADYGQVRVITVVKDGVTSLVVQVPGTEDWDPNRTGNTVDMTTNTWAMTGADTVMQQQVIAAIERAQAAHPGAAVMLTGHSQGGIVAATLAADPALVERLNITSLVTGGSPIARMPIDPSVSVLSVEHVQDPVPMLDGASNPDQTNWTTVRKELSAGQVTDQATPTPSPFTTHGTSYYAETGSLVDSSTDPSIEAWREQNAQFFGGDASSTTYVIEPGQ